MVCRLCSSRGVRLLRAGGLEYAECLRCGYIGLGRRFFPDREAEEARYRLHHNDPAEPGYRAYLSSFIEEALAPRLEAGADILDFGSGPTPALSVLLDERGYRAVPVDPYFEPSASWRRREWKAIALHEVAEHLRFPARTLSALARRLAPGGVLAIRTRFAPENGREFESWWYRQDITHLGFFRPASFRLLAERLGLETALVAPPDTVALRAPPSRSRNRLRVGPL